MKGKGKLGLCLLVALAFAACDRGTSPLILNGSSTGTRVAWQKTDNGTLIDIEAFMRGVGGRLTPMFLQQGFVAQYGKRIGFTANGYEYGMVQVKLCPMEPPARHEAGRLWAPLGFAAEVVGGAVTLNESGQALEVTAPGPLQIGDIVPEAETISSALESRGYTVSQGDMCLSDAIDVCFAGYSPNANGNNAGFPYLCIQPPQSPDVRQAVIAPSIAFTMREDEGFIIIGTTPPACDYYSFRSYLASRGTSDINPFKRQKIYAQLGDPINNYNILEDIFYPAEGKAIDGPYQSFYILVSTPDNRLYQDVLQAAAEAGLDQSKVLLDVIDHNLVRFGNDNYADLLNFLHRFSNPGDKAAGSAYTSRPTMEVLRLTPKRPREADFLEPFAPRQRGSGGTEDNFTAAVARLRQEIIDTYSPGYYIRELDTQVWLGDSGAAAIAKLEDVLGETRDTLYLRTDNFTFGQDTAVIVYGVNHSLVPKTVYTNVSCYGAAYFNGFGGITNGQYTGNIARNFPALDGVADMDKLYVYKFARTQLDNDTFVVRQDEQQNLKGIDYGDTAFMGFRNYIDPGSPDLLGPDPGEIILDRAMVLTPIHP